MKPFKSSLWIILNHQIWVLVEKVIIKMLRYIQSDSESKLRHLIRWSSLYPFILLDFQYSLLKATCLIMKNHQPLGLRPLIPNLKHRFGKIQLLTTFPLGQSLFVSEMSLGPTLLNFKLGWVSEEMVYALREGNFFPTLSCLRICP